MRALILILFSSSVWAGGKCGNLDKVAELIQQGRALYQSQLKPGSKAWDNAWNDWQTGITRELQTASYQTDQAAIVKSIKRNLDNEAASLKSTNAPLQNGSQALDNAAALEQKIAKMFTIEKKAAKTIAGLEKSNPRIFAQYKRWQEIIATEGWEKMRSMAGYKDEFLVQTQSRSSRLNIQYRVFYNKAPDGKIIVIDINEHTFN